MERLAHPIVISSAFHMMRPVVAAALFHICDSLALYNKSLNLYEDETDDAIDVPDGGYYDQQLNVPTLRTDMPCLGDGKWHAINPSFAYSSAYHSSEQLVVAFRASVFGTRRMRPSRSGTATWSSARWHLIDCAPTIARTFRSELCALLRTRASIQALAKTCKNALCQPATIAPRVLKTHAW